MELIILGLLMFRKCTIYEMKKKIEATFTSMSGSGTGSIQSAIKKLLGNNMINVTEYVEKGVNKKVYEITDEGKSYFLSCLSKPILYKEKSMELAKFFFMGFLPADKRIEMIDGYIAKLETEKAKFEEIRISAPSIDTAITDYISYLETNNAIMDFTDMLRSKSIHEGLGDIAAFQFASLELSIAKVEFEIHWFKQFKKRMEGI